jgi:hypothetical protein
VGGHDNIKDFLEPFICSLLSEAFYLLFIFNFVSFSATFVPQFLSSKKNKLQQTRNQAGQRNIIKESEGNDTKRKEVNKTKQLWNHTNKLHKFCTTQLPLLCLQHVSTQQKSTITIVKAIYEDNLQDVF